MLIHGGFANRRKDRERERERETSISRLTAFATRTAWPVCYRNGIVPILLSDLPSRRSRSTTYACSFVPRSCQCTSLTIPLGHCPFHSRLRLSRPLSATSPYHLCLLVCTRYYVTIATLRILGLAAWPFLLFYHLSLSLSLSLCLLSSGISFNFLLYTWSYVRSSRSFVRSFSLDFKSKRQMRDSCLIDTLPEYLPTSYPVSSHPLTDTIHSWGRSG